MPVLETVAAVAAIVSAFQGAATLYNGWKARKEASRRGEEGKVRGDNVTEQSLVLGRTTVQEEYDRAFSRVGDRFAQGDDDGRTQLQYEIIRLQQTVIDLLKRAADTGQLQIPELNSALERRRVSSVRALACQYQRMAVAAPIREPSLALQSARTDYFAFASNIHLEQMAKRCPTSLFRGKAVLRGYRWQINERGFANIIQSPAHRVEGLVFSIQYADQVKLDRYEGVAKGYYDRRSLSVQLAECVEGPWKTSFVSRRLKKGRAPKKNTRDVTIDASVYISLMYVNDGRIRAEYADRMDRGLADAVDLGMSRQYIQRYLRPCITAQNNRAVGVVSGVRRLLTA